MRDNEDKKQEELLDVQLQRLQLRDSFTSERVFEHNALLIFHTSVKKKKVSLHNFEILLDMFPLVSLQNTVRNERSYNSHITQLGEDYKIKLANTQNPFHSVIF